MRFSIALATAVLVSFVAPAPTAHAFGPEDIVRALRPPPKTQQSVTRSFRAPTRGIEIEGGDEKPAENSAPRIDLYVHFELDQSNLTMTDARLTLDALGKALKDPRLAKMKFEIIGHTDARGTDARNERLSQDRASAVKAYLIQEHKIDGALLVAKGMGKRQLKDPTRPEDGINRRVEIRTVVEATS